ncbi:MAG: SPOR domain-containing protein [Steroidobacteraceae bacterium]
MSSPRQRISARDYKHGGRRGGFDVTKYGQFGAGLAFGLLVALAVFVLDHRAAPADAKEAAQPRPAKEVAAATRGAGTEDTAEQYDFYDTLPKFEVVVPEQERDVRRDLPSVPIVLAGAYVLQAGSFTSEADAERQRQKIAKLGIDATLQRIAVDADVRHRVRIGPMRDLAKLNAARRQLRAADIDVLLIRLGD